VFETVVAVLLLIPKTARLAAIDCCVDDCLILSHVFVLDMAGSLSMLFMVMLLAVIYLLLTRRQSHWANRKCGDDGCLTSDKK